MLFPPITAFRIAFLGTRMADRAIRLLLGLDSNSGSSRDVDKEIVAAMAVDELARKEGRVRHRGSVIGRSVVNRNIWSGHDKLFADYFSSNPVYNDDTFRRRYLHRNLDVKSCRRLALLANVVCPLSLQV
jgi:hypothetical protein